MSEANARRGRLGQQVIVDGMLELARTDPHARITFKRLGESLGVDATAMYRHFRNKDELIRAALDRLLGMSVLSADERPRSWRDALELHLIRLAELSLEYPSIGAEGALVDPAGPGDTAAVEFILEMLHEGGLRDAELIRAYAAISGFALSQSAAMAQDVIAQEGAGRDGSIPWISTFGAVDTSAFPLVHAHRDALLAIDGMDVYRAGITAILDSVERATAG